MHLFEEFPDLMNIQEAADAMRVSASVVEELIDNREITYVTIGTRKVIYKSDIITYLEKNRHVCYDASNTMHLDNQTEADTVPYQEETDDMAIKINQAIEINGKKHWVTAKTAQEFANKIAGLMNAEGRDTPAQKTNHPFDVYALNWFETYSLPNIATVTATTYRRQIENILIPAFEGLAVEDITPDHVQQLFNKMSVAKPTKQKTKMVLNQILEAALEDKLISANPLRSRKVKITGAASKRTPLYSVEQMRYLAAHLPEVKNEQDRAFLALLIYHPMRLEEELGLKGEDLDRKNLKIRICRAVTHPKRNQPEIKETKTEVSVRTLDLSAKALAHIPETPDDEFILGGKKPLSYTEVRNMCKRIQKDIGFEEKITPRRFRTTVLTDIYDQTKDIKLAQQVGGHANFDTSLKHYIKGRETMRTATAAVENLYS